MLQSIVSWLGIAMVFIVGYGVGACHAVYMYKRSDVLGGE